MGLVGLAALAFGSAEAEELDFWVWGRVDGLEVDEAEALRDVGTRNLFWHAADARRGDKGWEFDAKILKLPIVEGIKVVPVIRLEAVARSVENPAAFEQFAKIAKDYLEQVGSLRVQIDYDCPDRLLGNYAALLHAIREENGGIELSATALAGWPGVSGFDQVAAAVTTLYPMFYDVRADDPAGVQAGRFEPILAGSDLIGGWENCSVRWVAGLPTFARVSIFKRSGELVGHVRRWEWDDLIFHSDFQPRVGNSPGAMVADVVRDTVIGGAAVKAGQVMVARSTTSSDLRAAVRLAIESGASGVAWFRLPGREASVGIAEAAAIGKGSRGEVKFQVALDERGRLELLNAGGGALPPRWLGRTGADDRGWQLEVETTGGFEFASAGEFIRMVGHREAEAAVPERVPIGEAERLTFWFSRLAVGGALRTGVLGLRQPEDAEIRWRVDGGPWNSVRSP